MGHRFEPCRGQLNIEKRLDCRSLFYFSKKELTLNRTLRACLSKRELFPMIISSKYMLCVMIIVKKQN